VKVFYFIYFLLLKKYKFMPLDDLDFKNKKPIFHKVEKFHLVSPLYSIISFLLFIFLQLPDI